jgi:hypothetical protein
MSMGEGFLAIWSDVAEADETDYLHWLTREHTAERVSVPGFLSVRVFRAQLPQHRRYFILYRLEHAGVVASAPYLARLNAPTEWSRRIMTVLKNFVRGGGRVVGEAGQGDGAIIVPIICRSSDVKSARAVLAQVAALDRVVSARLFEVDQSGTSIPTDEKTYRTRDQSFPALLILEGLDDTALDAGVNELRRTITLSEPLARYDQVFALHQNAVVKAGDV